MKFCQLHADLDCVCIATLCPSAVIQALSVLATIVVLMGILTSTHRVECEKRLYKQQTRANNTTLEPHHQDHDNQANNTHKQTMYTTKVHDQDEVGPNDDDTKATIADRPRENQQQTGFLNDALILSESYLSFQHGCRPTSF